MTLDTACSSSLIAVHQAVQSLRCGGSDLAIAVGANLILGPEMYINAASLHMLSPTARSRMWDAEADGYVRGEGFAVVVLKRLGEAIGDGDNIESTIRASGTNQDGRTQGITMPSSQAQRELIIRTYQQSGLDLHAASGRPQFFEAHGTGTPAGDPIEARAIHEAFFQVAPRTENHFRKSKQHSSLLMNGEVAGIGSRYEQVNQVSDTDNHLQTCSPLFVGSIKTAIGHLEGCAGLAGLLKASLAIQHSLIPANMLFDRLNPAIRPFYDHLEVPTKTLEWPKLPNGGPRRASVNSFGFGGELLHFSSEPIILEPLRC